MPSRSLQVNIMFGGRFSRVTSYADTRQVFGTDYRGKKMEKKTDLSDLCYLLGCSGENDRCPGNPACAILRKVIEGAKNTEQLLQPDAPRL